MPVSKIYLIPAQEVLEQIYPRLADSDLTPVLLDLQQLFKRHYKLNVDRVQVGVSDVPISTDGKPSRHVQICEFGGCHTSNHMIYINAHFEVAVRFYNKGICTRELYNKTLNWVMAHELAHEAYMYSASNTLKKEISEAAKKEHFKTSYLNHIGSNHPHYEEEIFCEYIASKLAPLVLSEVLSEVDVK